MLDIDSRMEMYGITLFRDADRKNQFFYLPGSPHITRENGRALFDLFSYRKGGAADQIASGGFLNMTVDLGIGDLKNRIENRLRDEFDDDSVLSPVMFSKGTARVIALGESSEALSGGAETETTPSGAPLVAKGPRFIQNILGAGKPSLIGDNRSIFSFSLSEEGAAFFLGVLQGSVDARPVGAVYELEYVGLLPSYDLEVTINFQSSYEYMRSRFTVGTLLFKADIDNIVEELQRRESIKIKETARTLELSTPEAVSARQKRIDLLVKNLASGALFKPSLTPGEPKVKDKVVTAADPTASVPSSSGSSSTAADALRHGASATVISGIAEALGGNTGRTSGAQSNTTGSTSAGSSSAQPAASTPTGGSRPSSAADVWNRLGRPQAAYAMKSISQTEMRTVTYNLSQVTAQKQTVAPQSFIQFLGDPRELNRNVHIVDLNHPFFQKLNINVNSLNVDYEASGITQMTVQLRYSMKSDSTAPKDTAEIILRGPGDSADFTFFMDKKLTQEYEYKLIVDYKTGFAIGDTNPRTESKWVKTEARSLSVKPEWVGRLHTVLLQLPPNIPEDLSEVHLVVAYRNEDAGIEDSASVRLSGEHPSETVCVRPVGEIDQFTVSQKVFYKDGTQEELPDSCIPDPDSGAADDALVIPLPAANLFTGDIIMQDPLSELQSVLVDTEVLQNGANVDSRTFEISEAGSRTVYGIRLPERDTPVSLQYRERRIYKDGGLQQEEWTEADNPNLVVGVPAADVLSVTVTYLAPKPSELGLAGILLDLNYSDPEGNDEYEQSASILISDDKETHIQDWNVRLPDRDSRTYQWKLTLFNDDGTETGTEFKDDTRSRLIIRPPQS